LISALNDKEYFLAQYQCRNTIFNSRRVMLG
jgi:hypothetical protein